MTDHIVINWDKDGTNFIIALALKENLNPGDLSLYVFTFSHDNLFLNPNQDNDIGTNLKSD